MAQNPILPALEFTRSVGRRQAIDDAIFDDAETYGKFPYEQNISAITRIAVYSDSNPGGDATIVTGLKVTYRFRDGTTTEVTRGLTTVLVETIFIDATNEMLVGANGRIKAMQGNPADGRIATIGFVKLNKATGVVTSAGPYPANVQNAGASWATFGPIVAFTGTRTDGVGLTSLGFVKNPSSVPFGN